MNKKGLSNLIKYFIIFIAIMILLFGMIMCGTLGGFSKLSGGG